MTKNKEGEGVFQGHPDQGKAIQKVQIGAPAGQPPAESSQEQEAFSAEFWNQFMARASVAPVGEDPVFWPVFMFSELQDVLRQREHIKNEVKRHYVERLTAMQETVLGVETAYKIIAYPHCTARNHRRIISASLEIDRQANGRDQVELTDAEMEILRRLCETPRYALTVDESGRNKDAVPVLQPPLPFDPHKRIYHYAAVPVPPDVDPCGRRHLTTEQIQRILAKKHSKAKK